MKRNINFEMVKELNNRLRELGQYKDLKYGYVINSLDVNASDIVNDITNNLVDEKTGEVLFGANEFNKFYHETKILSEEDEEKKSGYIALLVLARRVLEACIDLLGFEAPERM